VLLFLVIGCNTLPVGEDGLGRVPGADSLTFIPDSSAGLARYAVLGAADTMLLGRDDGYVSRVLINFELPDSALDSITRVQLILYPTDSTRMEFVCYPCTVGWDAGAATWRVADSSTHWLNPGGDFDSTTTVCRDTLLNDSLVIEIDPGLMPELVRESFGMILLPLDSGFAGISSGFSLANSPRIRIYRGEDEENISTINAIEDTHIVDTLGVNAGPGEQRVGSGFAFRTWLYFNLDSIPSEATIARAELRFIPVIEHRRDDTLRLGIRRLLEPFDRYRRNPVFADAPSGRLEYIIASESVPTATIDIDLLIQYWTAHPDSNFGLLIVAEPEWADFFRMRLPGSGANAPQLNVLYALPPTGRFW